MEQVQTAGPVRRVLAKILQQEKGRDTIAHLQERPAREAIYSAWPQDLRPELRAALEQRGVRQLYSHQAQAWQALAEQQNIVVVTPTASGKTLCYNLPVLQTLLLDPEARALYLFPTKALAQDQLAELMELGQAAGIVQPASGLSRQPSNERTEHALRLGPAAFTYDGDTPADARKAVRSRAQVVITNPDMLHSGILPHHTKWARFFSNLRFIVVDEMHTYRGVFGSHLANLFRRLHRLCKFHGSQPQFVLCSATIANPLELGQSLIERPCQLIDRNGSPSGKRTLIFYNPPVINKELGIRRSYLTASRRMATLFLKASVKTIIFCGSRLNVEVLTRYLKDRFERTESEVGRVRGYRGGYLPTARREIERGLRDGSVQGVISTNALELGIDIGSLDAAILAGYPGTVASTWQQAGRAGRRQSDCAVILVAKSDPLDQFLMQNPEFFFEQSPEHARINPDNLAILMSHLKCAAFELPLTVGERLGNAEVGEAADYLADNGVLHRSGNEYHWTQEVYPADMISLRTASPENFVIMDTTNNQKVIAEVDWHSAPSTVYQDAIYMCEAKTYLVERLDYPHRRAYVKPVEVDYYTDAITSTSVKILDSFARDSIASLISWEHGDVHVSWRVSGFKKIKFYSRENVGFGEVHLPDHEMHTTSFWLTFSEEFFRGLHFDQDADEKPLRITRADLLDGVIGLSFCLHHVAPLYLMCDHRDIQRSVGDRDGHFFERGPIADSGRSTTSNPEEPFDEARSESWMRLANPAPPPSSGGLRLDDLEVFEPTLYLYDNFPGGIGFSATVYDLFGDILGRTLHLLQACGCQDGCPSCVGPPSEVGSNSRRVATALAQRLCALWESKVRD